ncbi:MAG: hypothetical protein ABI574_09885 [Burkholderiales bacterium]
MSWTEEIAAVAARLVAEEGMEYGPAKRKAARTLGRGQTRAGELPSNEMVEDAVREHLALFCADTQPAELQALRDVAVTWMQRLVAFRPHLTGAVWRGTATRWSAVHLDLYCDDAKSAEIELINQGISYDVASSPGARGEPIEHLHLDVPCPALGERATLVLTLRDHDDLRGALKPDTRGRSHRGDLAALHQVMAEEAAT